METGVTVWLASLATWFGQGGYGLMMASFYLAMVLIERGAYLFENRRDWAERESRANMINWLLLAFFEGAVGAALFVGIYLWVYEHRLFTIPMVWWGWALAFLLNDLAYYSSHRMEHRTGFFWAIHTAHHSAETMNLTVAARNSVLLLSGASQPLYYLLALIGLPLPMFLVARFFGNVWGIFNHTRFVHRIKWLEGWVATPANHRVHHGTQPKYLDRNYGQVLMIWDRLFGTFQREEEEPIYGLVHQMGSTRIYDIQSWGARWLWGQLRSAPRWRDKLAYLVMPPGWRHDGRHETTEAIQRAALAA
ncbi:sterol desaturase family protein [Sphingomonas sp. GlSt437]|uniref:sterol desaturase family protein n=1 Tax=Sphingomonas sp. GlSt437 TaxID=3389970 RepID=UPI003A8B7555